MLDFSGDLYGEQVAVRFTHRIRADARFASVDELAAQLQLDCDRARQLLEVGPTPSRGRRVEPPRTDSRRYREVLHGPSPTRARRCTTGRRRPSVGATTGQRADPGARARRAPRRHRGRGAPSRPAPDRAGGRPPGRGDGRRQRGAAGRRPRVLRRGVPVRPVAVAAGEDGLPGHRDRHRRPRGHPGPAAERSEPQRLRRAAGPCDRRARHRAVRGRRALDGRPADHPHGGHPAGPGHRRGPHRCDRRRHLGPDGVPVPGRPGPAGRGRRAPAARLGDHRAGVLGSAPGDQAAPAGDPDAGRPRAAAVEVARPDDDHPAQPVQQLCAR